LPKFSREKKVAYFFPRHGVVHWNMHEVTDRFHALRTHRQCDGSELSSAVRWFPAALCSSLSRGLLGCIKTEMSTLIRLSEKPCTCLINRVHTGCIND